MKEEISGTENFRNVRPPSQKHNPFSNTTKVGQPSKSCRPVLSNYEQVSLMAKLFWKLRQCMNGSIQSFGLEAAPYHQDQIILLLNTKLIPQPYPNFYRILSEYSLFVKRRWQYVKSFLLGSIVFPENPFLAF